MHLTPWLRVAVITAPLIGCAAGGGAAGAAGAHERSHAQSPPLSQLPPPSHGSTGSEQVGPEPQDPAHIEHPSGAVIEDDAADGDATTADATAGGPQQAHPLDDKSDAELQAALRQDPAALGSLSLGRPNAGRLLGGVAMPRVPGIQLVDPQHSWGTQETVDFLESAVASVRAQFPEAHPLYLGHISAKHGGPLSPHRSHQSGRDVDISYYYVGDSARWYARATKKTLDVEKTWAFVRALIELTDVNLIIIDHSIQRLLRAHASALGEDPAWLDSVFRGVPGKRRPLIVHASGHATHMHIRFFNPVAQESARRAMPLLAALGAIDPPVHYVMHRVKPGETLGMLARK
ncbi:MAG TPA: penicillin-insensitive murein endopeptidase, partial [Polyangiaceae bacterium]|nr:penicillin-insensitive murein endopeptidase [Polyangiaceae bacterium]